MKYLRCYNTQVEEIEGWPTTDKRGGIDLIDKHNGYAFCITFGKIPKVSIYKNSDDQNLGELVFRKRITDKPSREDVKEDFNQYLNDLAKLG